MSSKEYTVTISVDIEGLTEFHYQDEEPDPNTTIEEIITREIEDPSCCIGVINIKEKPV